VKILKDQAALTFMNLKKIISKMGQAEAKILSLKGPEKREFDKE
jgi:hypothetical protein